MTYNEFKKQYRAKEEREGATLDRADGTITPQPPKSEDELKALYQSTTEAAKTGLYSHGPAIKLNDVGF